MITKKRLELLGIVKVVVGVLFLYFFSRVAVAARGQVSPLVYLGLLLVGGMVLVILGAGAWRNFTAANKELVGQTTTKTGRPFLTVVVDSDQIQEKVTQLAQKEGFEVTAPLADKTRDDKQIVSVTGPYGSYERLLDFAVGVHMIGDTSEIEVYKEYEI